MTQQIFVVRIIIYNVNTGLKVKDRGGFDWKIKLGLFKICFYALSDDYHRFENFEVCFLAIDL